MTNQTDPILVALQQHYQEMGYAAKTLDGSLAIITGEKDDIPLKLGITIVEDYLLVWPLTSLREVATPYNNMDGFSCRLPLADPSSLTELDKIITHYIAETNKLMSQSPFV